MRVTPLILALSVGCLPCSSVMADLVVSSTTPAAVDTAFAPQVVTFTISLASFASATQGVDALNVQFVLQGPAGGALSGTITAAPGSPAFSQSPDANSTFADFSPNFVFDNTPPATPFINVFATINQGVTGTFFLRLDNSQSMYAPDPAGAPQNFANSFDVNGFATLATVTAVPEASAYMFGGIASLLGGVVAWRRRSQVA